ncbi:Solute carrier family 46 member 3 [Camelus dromedarius]|uniref:Solute carrier family 46 member 3 n=1 Tax=Camelus dromedarius TaxID=9838 RepID=A0A5N4D9A4_CAMDR|nr:Solute carrier family 46 member 3 [Camelus dromedarius]
MQILFVEPAICLSAFAMSLAAPLTTQYVYRRIWEETGNYSIAPDSNISECAKNKSSPIFAFQEEVQKKVSLFNLQMDMSGLIPGLVSTFILLSHSDQRGRKFPLVLSSVVCGNSTTFLGASFAYIVDQCKEQKQRTIRIAVIDFLLGIVTGLTALSSGYFIRELDIHMAFIGIFTTMVGMAMTAFARTTLMMFLVRLPFLFTVVPLSVLRSMMTKVVRPTEQGTLFACIAFLETLGGVTAVSTFNGIYSATVAWHKGFVFLLSAVLLLIPAISLCAVKCISRNAGSHVLLVQEEPSEDTSDR